MQIIDSCRVSAPLRETSVFAFDFAFDFACGVGENTILANTAHSDVLRHSGPQTSASTIRNEGRKRDRRKAAQSEDWTSGNPDSMYTERYETAESEYEVKLKQGIRKCDRNRHRSAENATRPARDVGKAEYCEANGRQVMHKCDRCRHRSSEYAIRLAWDFGKAEEYAVM